MDLSVVATDLVKATNFRESHSKKKYNSIPPRRKRNYNNFIV